MQLLVCYDVNTTSPEGERRLRRVAQTCQAFGQRVQYSVFECRVNDTRAEQLRQRLLDLIEPDVDSLRIYSLPGDRDVLVEAYGVDRYRDYSEPLVI